MSNENPYFVACSNLGISVMSLRDFFTRSFRVFAALLLLSSGAAIAQHMRVAVPTGIDPVWSSTWIDADGDGRDDLCFLASFHDKDLVCHLNKATGTEVKYVQDLWQGEYAATSGSLRWVDINGDGFVDVCRAVELPTSRLACRLGPEFNGSSIEVPWTLAASTRYCSGVPSFSVAQCLREGGTVSYQFTPGIANVPSAFSPPDYHLVDVNGDGLPDLCYVYRPTETTTDLRCRIATIGVGRTTVIYSPETADWTRANIATGADYWPQGFHDFNGDGFADFCRVLPGGTLRCTLSGSTGLVQTEVSSPVAVPVQWPEGAAFVDINGDGNVDFCRLAGGTGAYYIRCTLSNGLGWEFNSANPAALELVSPTFADPGDANSRWWVDVNADGLPDFCRLTGASGGSGQTDQTGTLLCRLSRGGGNTAGSLLAFGSSDVSVINFNIGRAGGGRSFCDPFGNGIAVLCRLTANNFATTELWCQWSEAGETCWPFVGYTSGYAAGYSDSSNQPVIQARQGLLSSFSDGVGAETRVTYLPLTSGDVYSRSNTTSNTHARILLVQPRSPVVFETRAWTAGENGYTLTGNARYLYKDLRTDTLAGSRGFRERWTYHEGANTVDHVVYYQALGAVVEGATTGSVENDLREIGMVKCQEKFAVQAGAVPTLSNLSSLNARQNRLRNIRLALQAAPSSGPCGVVDQEPSASSPFILLQATTNLLGNTTPVSNPRFKIVKETVSKTWDWNGAARVALSTTTSKTETDPWGNATKLEQYTQDSANREWRKTTTNTYSDNPGLWLLGRLTRSELTTLTPTAAVQLAAHGSSVGNSSNAGLMAPPVIPPPAPTPLSPAVLSVILQLLLD